MSWMVPGCSTTNSWPDPSPAWVKNSGDCNPLVIIGKRSNAVSGGRSTTSTRPAIAYIHPTDKMMSDVHSLLAICDLVIVFLLEKPDEGVIGQFAHPGLRDRLLFTRAIQPDLIRHLSPGLIAQTPHFMEKV